MIFRKLLSSLGFGQNRQTLDEVLITLSTVDTVLDTIGPRMQTVRDAVEEKLREPVPYETELEQFFGGKNGPMQLYLMILEDTITAHDRTYAHIQRISDYFSIQEPDKKSYNDERNREKLALYHGFGVYYSSGTCKQINKDITDYQEKLGELLGNTRMCVTTTTTLFNADDVNEEIEKWSCFRQDLDKSIDAIKQSKKAIPRKFKATMKLLAQENAQRIGKQSYQERLNILLNTPYV